MGALSFLLGGAAGAGITYAVCSRMQQAPEPEPVPTNLDGVIRGGIREPPAARVIVSMPSGCVEPAGSLLEHASAWAERERMLREESPEEQERRRAYERQALLQAQQAQLSLAQGKQQSGGGSMLGLMQQIQQNVASGSRLSGGGAGPRYVERAAPVASVGQQYMQRATPVASASPQYMQRATPASSASHPAQAPAAGSPEALSRGRIRTPSAWFFNGVPDFNAARARLAASAQQMSQVATSARGGVQRRNARPMRIDQRYFQAFFDANQAGHKMGQLNAYAPVIYDSNVGPFIEYGDPSRAGTRVIVRWDANTESWLLRYLAEYLVRMQMVYGR